MPAHPRAGLRHASPGRHASPAQPRRRRRSGLAAGALTTLLVVSGAPLAVASPAPAAAPVASSTTAAVTAAPSIATRPVTQSTLRYGMRSSQVRSLQVQLGVTPRSGWFGPRTRAAVKRFQHRHHLPVTGVVDTRTRTALAEAKAASARAKARASRAAPRQALALTPGVRALQVAPRYAGTPYRYGGSTPSGFDCSGYVRYVFSRVGVGLPRSSAAMRSAVPRISASQRRSGDLVFVHRGGRVSHVAIYAGNGRWWEASRPGKPVGLHKAWTSSVSYGRVG